MILNICTILSLYLLPTTPLQPLIWIFWSATLIVQINLELVGGLSDWVALLDCLWGIKILVSCKLSFINTQYINRFSNLSAMYFKNVVRRPTYVDLPDCDGLKKLVREEVGDRDTLYRNLDKRKPLKQ